MTTVLTIVLALTGCGGFPDIDDWEAAQQELRIARLERQSSGDDTPCFRSFTPARELPQDAWEVYYFSQNTEPPEYCTPGEQLVTDLPTGDCLRLQQTCFRVLEDPQIGSCELSDDPFCCNDDTYLQCED